MKFDFWFDLPKALSDLSNELLSKEELNLCENIQINSKVYLILYYNKTII